MQRSWVQVPVLKNKGKLRPAARRQAVRCECGPVCGFEAGGGPDSASGTVPSAKADLTGRVLCRTQLTPHMAAGNTEPTQQRLQTDRRPKQRRVIQKTGSKQGRLSMTAGEAEVSREDTRRGTVTMTEPRRGCSSEVRTGRLEVCRPGQPGRARACGGPVRPGPSGSAELSEDRDGDAEPTHTTVGTCRVSSCPEDAVKASGVAGVWQRDQGARRRADAAHPQDGQPAGSSTVMLRGSAVSNTSSCLVGGSGGSRI